MKSDLEIAREASLIPVIEVRTGLGLEPNDMGPYGKHKTEIHIDLIKREIVGLF